MMKRNCKQCNKEFEKKLTTSFRVWKIARKFCSRTCSLGSRTKEKHPRWRGNDAGYAVKHGWMIRHHGKANKCQNREKSFLGFECNEKSSIYHWAKIKDKKYDRNIKSYMMLCVSCHKYYDFTEEARKNLSESHKIYYKKQKLINKDYAVGR